MSAITNFDFHNLMPGQQLPPVQEVTTKGSVLWGPIHHQQFFPGIIDGTARDAGNTGYTNVLRPGLLLGRVSGTKKYKQYDPTATDGTQNVAAVLMHAVKVQMDSTDRDRFMGYVLIRGGVRSKGIQLASSSSDGIVGNASEWVIRRQMDTRFIFDDRPEGYALSNNFMDLSAATLTLTEAMVGVEVFCTGTTAKTITLPASPKRGLRYTVYNTDNGNLTLTCATADIIIGLNDTAADSVALSTANELTGGSFEIIGTGTKWMVVPRLWEAQTVTLAT